MNRIKRSAISALPWVALIILLIVAIELLDTMEECVGTSQLQITEAEATNDPTNAAWTIEAEKIKRIISQQRNEVKALEQKIEFHENQVEKLKEELKSIEYPEGYDLASVLLTASAVILTALGVVIAVVSFFGFRNIKKIAERQARRSTKKTIALLLPEFTKNNITKMLNKGEFDAVIEDAVYKIVYRGVGTSDEITDEEKP